jgi:hypothetical protein
LLQRINALDIPYGREDSFMLARLQLIRDRVLISMNIAFMPAAKWRGSPCWRHLALLR